MEWTLLRHEITEAIHRFPAEAVPAWQARGWQPYDGPEPESENPTQDAVPATNPTQDAAPMMNPTQDAVPATPAEDEPAILPEPSEE